MLAPGKCGAITNNCSVPLDRPLDKLMLRLTHRPGDGPFGPNTLALHDLLVSVAKLCLNSPYVHIELGPALFQALPNGGCAQ